MGTHSRLWLLVASALLLPATVCAHPSDDTPYAVQVENEYGERLPTYHHGGQVFVLGALGERYALRLRNHSGRRVEAVVTVDGRDAVSGRVGDFVRERGYLIDAYGEVLVEGFRRNYDEVAAFRFSSPGGSYSARMGTPENVGILGVAFFPERERPRPVPMAAPRRMPRTEHRARASRDHGGGLGTASEAAKPAAPADAASSERASRAEGKASSGAAYDAEPPSAEHDDYARGPSTDNLGTEYGETRSSAAREVAFVRADARRPARVLTLRYDDREGLLARGIDVWGRRAPVARRPDAFPHNRFAPPPP